MSGDTAYRVTVVTGDVDGAGTDARVTLRLHGDRDLVAVTSDLIRLDTPANDFERAHADRGIRVG